MRSSQRPQSIAIALIKEVKEERLLWLIVSFIQGRIQNDDCCYMLNPPRRCAWGIFVLVIKYIKRQSQFI